MVAVLKNWYAAEVARMLGMHADALLQNYTDEMLELLYVKAAHANYDVNPDADPEDEPEDDEDEDEDEDYDDYDYHDDDPGEAQEWHDFDPDC